MVNENAFYTRVYWLRLIWSTTFCLLSRVAPYIAEHAPEGCAPNCLVVAFRALRKGDMAVDLPLLRGCSCASSRAAALRWLHAAMG